MPPKHLLAAVLLTLPGCVAAPPIIIVMPQPMSPPMQQMVSQTPPKPSIEPPVQQTVGSYVNAHDKAIERLRYGLSVGVETDD